MAIRKHGIALAGALALSLTLGGCFGTDPSSLKPNFIGTWELDHADFADDSSDIDAEAYQIMSTQLDMHATIDLDENGNMLVDIFGTQETGTWTVKDESTLTLDIDGSRVDCPVSNDQITLTVNDETMVFNHKDSEPEMTHEVSSGTTGTTTGTVDYASPQADAQADLYINDVTEVSAKNVTVADDEYVSIVVYAIGSDYEGDPGYLMTVQNKTDDEIYVVSNNDIKVDGVSVSGSLFRHINSADTKKCYFFFNQDDVTLTSSSTCTCTVSVYGADYSLLREYALSI